MGAISGDWQQALAGEFRKPYYASLYKTVMHEYQTVKVFPPAQELFNAFHFTPLHEVKVVILGQDPYHQPGQAMGMCFSVKPRVPLPKSLINIYKEIEDDLHIKMGTSGNLIPWAMQGVLLINSVMTVRQNQPNSHAGQGWEIFTDHVIQKLDSLDQPMVFLLWGRNARNKKELLRNPKHLVLEAAHPSPLSAYNGFFGCRHFSKTNQFLKGHGVAEINWKI